MKAADIRAKFLEYFEKNGHAVVSSSPLVPRDDPSLLFTNAGMVQFKKTFLGQEKRPYDRATTSQKCLRVGGKHNDLENVGRTARHHTFFEMLGNFSFGDYFKKDAIRFAWEFLTVEMGLDKDKLYVTVFRDDDEAAELWPEATGIPVERIYRMGEKDNFWAMGDTGPCGPCSEILYDQGESMTCGPDCGIGKCDCDRYLEIWNLVFMQYDQDESGTRTPLPRPSIDTGMGLERIAAVCQGVRSNFDTDLFTPVIEYAAELAGVDYRESEDVKVALQVIADHSRSMAFLITDQILPSNEGRGYVLRRLIRRAFRFGRLLGMADPFLHKTANKVVDIMFHAFPELDASRDFMARVIRQEEERFSQTLDKGLAILEEEMAALDTGGVISGETAFKLYDTYGFPLDIVTDVAGKAGLGVDEEGFKTAMDEQKARAKKAWKGSGEKDTSSLFAVLLEQDLANEFIGHDALAGDSRIVALLNAEGGQVDSLGKGAEGYMACAVTPFYGESGGQVGDTGSASTLTGRAEVLDTVNPGPNLTLHKIKVAEGEVAAEQEVALEVDEASRTATARNHTCTHLLHAALREVLGDHVRQSGSLVGPKRLRFDFTHISGLSLEETEKIEAMVNAAIMADEPVLRETMAHDAAVARGAMALFGEKYADEVCVVEVPGVSMELCGGTHLSRTGQAGFFSIVSESGVAAGVRRIEAATGANALARFQSLRGEMDEVAGRLKARPGEVADKLTGLYGQIKDKDKEIERLQAKLASGGGKDLMSGAKEISGIKILAAKSEAGNPKALRDQMDTVKSRLGSGAACLATETGDGKVSLVVYVSPDLHGRFKAGGLIKPVAAKVGGGGGGRPDMAQAGGSDPSGIDGALLEFERLIEAG